MIEPYYSKSRRNSGYTCSTSESSVSIDDKSTKEQSMEDKVKKNQSLKNRRINPIQADNSSNHNAKTNTLNDNEDDVGDDLEVDDGGEEVYSVQLSYDDEYEDDDEDDDDVECGGSGGDTINSRTLSTSSGNGGKVQCYQCDSANNQITAHQNKMEPRNSILSRQSHQNGIVSKSSNFSSNHRSLSSAHIEPHHNRHRMIHDGNKEDRNFFYGKSCVDSSIASNNKNNTNSNRNQLNGEQQKRRITRYPHSTQPHTAVWIDSNHRSSYPLKMDIPLRSSVIDLQQKEHNHQRESNKWKPKTDHSIATNLNNINSTAQSSLPVVITSDTTADDNYNLDQKFTRNGIGALKSKPNPINLWPINNYFRNSVSSLDQSPLSCHTSSVDITKNTNEKKFHNNSHTNSGNYLDKQNDLATSLVSELKLSVSKLPTSTTTSTTPNNYSSNVPILISTKDLESACGSVELPPTYRVMDHNSTPDSSLDIAKGKYKNINIHNDGGAFDNPNQSAVKRTKSFQERIHKMLWRSAPGTEDIGVDASPYTNNSNKPTNAPNSNVSKKFVSPRLSILGKPLPQSKRRELSFYRERMLVYNLLQRPKGAWAVGYHIFVIFIIVVGLFFACLSTVKDMESWATIVVRVMDIFIITLLTVEFIARLWSRSCVSKYRGWRGAIRFILSPFRLIDMLVICVSALVLWAHFVSSGNKNIYWLRFAQVFQILRLGNRFKPWRIMGSVIWSQRDHLAIAVYMSFLSLMFISFTVYFAEHDQPGTNFTSIPNTIWWGIVSLLTIGYGDMAPETTAGKILGGMTVLLSVATFALPAGILGTGLALKVQEQQRQKHINKRTVPAARLIQCAWRCYASSPNSTSVATWKACLKRNSLSNNSQNSTNSGKQKTMDSSKLSLGDAEHLNESTRSKWQPFSEDERQLGEFSLKKRWKTNRSKTPISVITDDSEPSPNSLNNHRKSWTLNSKDKQEENNDLTDSSLISLQGYFSPQEKICIRFIRIVRYQMARRHFKNAFRPYDINDVMEQYAAGHADVVSRVRSMQSRINTVQMSLTNVMKVCQDLNYIQYHQFERLETTLHELIDRVILLQNNGNSNGFNHANTHTLDPNYLNVCPRSPMSDTASTAQMLPTPPSYGGATFDRYRPTTTGNSHNQKKFSIYSNTGSEVFFYGSQPASVNSETINQYLMMQNNTQSSNKMYPDERVEREIRRRIRRNTE